MAQSARRLASLRRLTKLLDGVPAPPLLLLVMLPVLLVLMLSPIPRFWCCTCVLKSSAALPRHLYKAGGVLRAASAG